MVKEKLIEARATYGFFPADRIGEDVHVYASEADRVAGKTKAVFCMLRQQEKRKQEGTGTDVFRSLADFVAPRGSDVRDHVGAFAVTAGLGVEELALRFKNDHDDYSAIIVKALADRLAEALAEMLHARVRREWRYGKDEKLDNDALIAEKYRGIRPAFGYPACPDHSEKRRLFELVGAASAGMSLTESCAMTPAASVSGLYFCHPEARYFNLGKIGRDQLEDYAKRKGENVVEAERWLGPNLAPGI
jgi:5-methyltetrahydrofolate--homocysteine methyltransferase